MVQEPSPAPAPETESHYTPRQAVDVLSSLISFSHSTRVFAVKWQTIRHNLQELIVSLAAIESCDPESNPILSAVLRGVMAAAGDCYDLARRCVDVSYSGKLLMQSDLDIIAARFGRHLANLSGVCNSGVLTHGFAIVVSRPGVGSSKEDLRFYVRDLSTRLKIGDGEMKKQALANLGAAVDEDERYVRVMVELGEIVASLVKLLDSSSLEIQESAAKLVGTVSGFDSYKQILIGAGVIAPLIRVLETGGELGKISSARCLMKLTQNSDNAWSVSAHGGVTALLKLCSDESAELVIPASAVLKNLAAVEEIKRFMIEDGAVSTFVKLARSSEETVQVTAIEFLQFIASRDGAVSTVREIVVKEGGIRAMVRVLDPNIDPASSPSSKCRETALLAIENLCFNSPDCITLLSTFNFLQFLLHFLRFGESSLKELSLKVACRLSATSDEAKRAMCDFTPEFVKFLDAKSVEVREMAGQAIVGMLSVPRNLKRFLHDDLSIGFILQLIDNEDTNCFNKFLVPILLSLTNSGSWRRKIVGSGYLKSIEKLAESEGVEGKKLVKKLGSGRFRSIINGIIRH